MPTINQLMEHMHKYKDAVVLIGPDAVKELKLYESGYEERNKKFSKRTLRRDAHNFWHYFTEQVYRNPEQYNMTDAQANILNMYKLGLVSNIVDLNGDGLMLAHSNLEDGLSNSLIQLHGNSQAFTCQNPDCKTIFSYQYVFDSEDLFTNCEVCGKPLRPNVLLLGENYDDDKFHALKVLISTTHTLITVGVNYSEDPIVDLIANFGDIKTLSKQQEDAQDPSYTGQRMLIGIHKPELELDVNEIAFHEFLSKDESAAATSRLLKAMREYNA